jgi:hypothetical protein
MERLSRQLGANSDQQESIVVVDNALLQKRIPDCSYIQVGDDAGINRRGVVRRQDQQLDVFHLEAKLRLRTCEAYCCDQQ